MKKKILFIEEGLGVGGAEKSLLTILSMLDYHKYDVDLFLFRHDDEFMDLLPEEVELLEESACYRIFRKNPKLAPLKFLIKLDWKRFYHSFVYLIKALYYKMVGKLYIGWEHIQYMFEELNKEYDTSIAFLERKTIYFNVDKVDARNKIGFIHTDYSKYAYDYKSDKKYFKSYNKIATVSENAKDVLIKIFPEYKEKFLVIKNMISQKMIKQMAKEKLDIDKKEKITIVTVGRLIDFKRIDMAVDVCKMLVDHSYDVKWYEIGEGAERKKLEKQIMDYHLQDRFILLGLQKNPYNWMEKADIYVQPSRMEGFGITVCEAKALAKPIVATEIPAFKEQILDEINGFLVKDSEMMYNKIVEIIENKNGIRDTFIENLKKDMNIENREELEKLYEIINEE